MIAQHTPGPWKAERFAGESNIWADRKGPAIAYRIGVEEDARLIAAAPELYEALREACDLIDLLGRECADRVWDGQRGRAVTANKFRAALAKAEGKQ